MRLHVTQLAKFKEESKNAPARVLCVLEEKYKDLCTAQWSEFGLSVNAEEFFDLRLPQTQGVDVGVLETEVSHAQQALRDIKKRNNVQDCANDGSFKIGAIIHRQDEIEGTSDEIYREVVRHEKRKAEVANLEDNREKNKLAEKRQRQVSLPLRLKAATEELDAPGSGQRNTVTKCRTFLKLLSEVQDLSEPEHGFSVKNKGQAT